MDENFYIQIVDENNPTWIKSWKKWKVKTENLENLKKTIIFF
jgi:hypothetical protein